MRPATRRWFASVVRGWQLDEHHVRLLTLACEAWDRGEEARERLAVEGLTVKDRFGQVKPHPCAGIERDAASTFRQLVRELDLDTEPAPEAARPPQLGRYRSA